MHAIISDVHANREALVAVLQDIRERHIERIICLGDTVGYGADPEECIDLVAESCAACVSGNHDYAVLTAPVQFNPVAEEAVAYTQERLHMGPLGALGLTRAQGRRRWLESLPLRHEEDGALYVHGSPRDERIEYILPDDGANGNVAKLREIFSMSPRLLFVGHTHYPGVITEDLQFRDLRDFDYRLTLDRGRKYIINAGSVGQPRDGDNRACYVIVDGEQIMFCRVPYDYRAAMKRIAEIGPLSRSFSDRLAHGR